MRYILITFLALGIAIIFLSQFQRVEIIAKWSMVYDLISSPNTPNPLKDKNTQQKFDHIFTRETFSSKCIFYIGFLISALSIFGVFIDSRHKQAQQDAAANP